MKHTFSAVAISACLAVPAIAQDIPAPISKLGLTNIEIREKPIIEYGRRVYGTLPGGALVEIELNGDDVVEDIDAQSRDLFPVEEIQSLIPTPVAENTSWPADARLESIDFDNDGRIEIEGRLSDGREFDAEFDADGTMIEFDIDD